MYENIKAWVFNIFLAGAKRQALQVTSSQEAEAEGTKFKIEHNLLNFWARSRKFCVEIRMDSSNKLQKYEKVHKYKSTHNSAIFLVTDFRFCMEVYMDSWTKWQSTKIEKV